MSEMTPEQLLKIAIHEAGHAVVACAVGRGAEIEGAFLAPYAKEGYGLVQRRPSSHWEAVASRRDLETTIIIKLGGRAAEEVFFGPEEVGVGSWGDLNVATECVEKMVAWYGFGGSLGLLTRTLAEVRSHPAVMEETKRMLDESYQTAIRLVKENAEAVGKVATKLLEARELGGDEIRGCIDTVPRP
jgi:cell division protease FtsH